MVCWTEGKEKEQNTRGHGSGAWIGWALVTGGKEEGESG